MNASSLHASRRSFIGMAAATLAAGAPAGAALAVQHDATDPVFAAIETYHRAAAALRDADIRVQDLEERHGGASVEARLADADSGLAFDREQDAIEAVIRTAPATIAGLAAWSVFLQAHLDRISALDDVRPDLVEDLVASVVSFAVAAHDARRRVEGA